MRTLILLTLAIASGGCGDSGTGPDRYDFPEITVEVSLLHSHGSTECIVRFLATAKNSNDVVSFELYAPGALGSPTAVGSGKTPIGVDALVQARDFFLDWNVTGPSYQYSAPNPGAVKC